MWLGFKSQGRRHIWLSLLLVLSFATRGFSSGTPVFPSPQKPTFPNSNSTRNRVDEEPLCGCATSKSLSWSLLLERLYGWCNHTYCIVAFVLALRGYWWYKRGRIFFLFTPPCSLRACTQAMVLLLLFSNYWMLMSILMLRRCLLLSVRVQVRDIKDGLSYTYSSNSSCHSLRSNFALLVMFVGRRSATVVRKICECFAVFSSCTKTTVLTQPRPKCFQVAIPYSANSLYYINLPDIAIYAFQIWSMLTGYEKLARGFEGIRNREIL